MLPVAGVSSCSVGLRCDCRPLCCLKDAVLAVAIVTAGRPVGVYIFWPTLTILPHPMTLRPKGNSKNTLSRVPYPNQTRKAGRCRTADGPSIGLDLLPSVGLDLLPSVGLDLLPSVGLDLLPSVGLDLLPSVGLDLLPSVGLDLLPSVGLDLLPSVGLDLLPSVGLDLLSSVGLDLLPSVGDRAGRGFRLMSHRSSCPFVTSGVSVHRSRPLSAVVPWPLTAAKCHHGHRWVCSYSR